MGILCQSTRFDKDEHNHLLRHFFHIKQTTTVSKYVEQFSDLVNQILAHDPTIQPSVVTNRFVDGLKKDIRVAVMMHRPQDLDTASSLAFLQEEATQDQPLRRMEFGTSSKKNSQDAVKTVHSPASYTSKAVDEKKTVDTHQHKSPEEYRLTKLKNYGRSKGLCFVCGEKWGPNHKCPENISLNAIQEIWKCLADLDETELPASGDESDSADDLMAISVQALNGTEGSKTIKLRGHLQGKEIFMLIDSGSSHSFICEHIASSIKSWHSLLHPIKV